MNKEEILILAKAGFTAQQIAALNTVGVAAPAPAPEPAPAPAPAPTVPFNPVALPQGATIDDVLASVQGLTQVVQSNALLSTQQPKPVTAEDILAEIINPPVPDKGGKI